MQIPQKFELNVKTIHLNDPDLFRLAFTSPINISTTIIKLSLQYNNVVLENIHGLPPSVTSLDLNMHDFRLFDFSSLPSTLKKIKLPKSLETHLGNRCIFTCLANCVRSH